MPDLKGLSFIASLFGALALAGCPMATGGSDAGSETGTSSGSSGGATSTGSGGGTTGGSGSTGGGSTTGAGTGGTTTSGGSSGGASTSGGTGSGSGTSGGTSTGGTTSSGSGGSTSGGTTGATDGGADAGTSDAGCVLADCEDAGYTCCTGFDHCVDTTNDSANCGTCGKVCAIDEICSGGTCSMAPCNGSLCGVAGGCCLDSCCNAGQICCEVHNGAVTISCYNATDGCPLSCKLCP